MIEQSATRFNNGDWFHTKIDTDERSCVVSGFLNGETIEFSSEGNPNRVQTVNGTAENPFGDIDKVALNTALLRNQATVKMELDFSVIGAGTILAYVGALNTSEYDDAFVLNAGDALQKTAGTMGWLVDGSISLLYMSQGDTSTNIKSYAPNIPTITKIIWHPLP